MTKTSLLALRMLYSQIRCFSTPAYGECPIMQRNSRSKRLIVRTLPLAYILVFSLGVAVAGTQMELTSDAFRQGGAIPAAYTCTGNDISPPLRWRDVPPDAKALALIVSDPDAP